MTTVASTAAAAETTEPDLVDLSALLWRLVPPPGPDEPTDTPLPRVGQPVPASVFTAWLNHGSWDEVAASWPALDPSQRTTVAYALSGVTLPPGYLIPSIPPTDWLVAMTLVSRRVELLAGSGLTGRQWTLAWTSAARLLPSGLRTGPAGTWLGRVGRDMPTRHSLRRAALSTELSLTLPFDVVWDMAQPLTRDTVDAVAGHPAATVDALAAAGRFTPLSPRAKAHLAVSPLYPAAEVPPLYTDADKDMLGPLLAAEIPHGRLVDLLDQTFPRPVAKAIAASQQASHRVAGRLTASTRVLTAVFDGLDVTKDPDLCDRALQARRPEPRRALAATVTDPQVLATLAADPDDEVRATAARRVLDALTPPDRHHPGDRP